MIALLIPLAFGALRLIFGNYIFSALTTLSCAVITAFSAHSAKTWLVFAALIVSAVGDWFMAHRGSRSDLFAIGIGCFFAAHVLFIFYALPRLTFAPSALIAGLFIAALYALLSALLFLPNAPKLLRVPIVLYALISVACFTLSLMTGDSVFAVGIGLLLFSDTVIALSCFTRYRGADFAILPTYYLCHILITLTQIR